MKIAPFSVFRIEDFTSQQSWINTLFLPLNNVLTQVTQALNGQITRADNIPSFTKSISGSGLSLPLTFKLDASFTPIQMIVAQAFKAGVPIVMAGAWSLSGDTITVSKLYELTDSGNVTLSSSPKYAITLVFT